MKNMLLIVLVLISIVMIILSVKMSILPPGLTGIGFLIISYLFYKKD